MEHSIEEILENASRLFKQYGIRNVTMSEVAGAVGISKKTLYQYISDKNDLIDTVLSQEFIDQEKRLQKIASTNEGAINKLIPMLRIMNSFLHERSLNAEFDLKKYHPEKYSTLIKKYSVLLEKYIRINIEEGKLEGVYRPDIDADKIAKLQVMHLVSVPDNTTISLDEYLSDAFFNEMISYHLNALLTVEKKNQIEKFLKNHDTKNH